MQDRTELREKIYRGIKTAIDNLIEERAKENGYLIVPKDGEIIKISAKEIFEERKRQGSVQQ